MTAFFGGGEKGYGDEEYKREGWIDGFASQYMALHGMASEFFLRLMSMTSMSTSASASASMEYEENYVMF